MKLEKKPAVTHASKKEGITPGKRHALPKRDDSHPEASHPDWTNWKKTPPTQPGWYWVCADGVWPQIVEFAFTGGSLQAIDRHTSSNVGEAARPFWRVCAGPIPDPIAPRFAGRKA